MNGTFCSGVSGGKVWSAESAGSLSVPTSMAETGVAAGASVGAERWSSALSTTSASAEWSSLELWVGSSKTGSSRVLAFRLAACLVSLLTYAVDTFIELRARDRALDPSSKSHSMVHRISRSLDLVSGSRCKKICAPWKISRAVLPRAREPDGPLVNGHPQGPDSVPEYASSLLALHLCELAAAPHGHVPLALGHIRDDRREEVEVVVDAGGGVEGRLLDVGGGVADAAARGEDLVALVAWQRAVSGRASRALVLRRAFVAAIVSRALDV